MTLFQVREGDAPVWAAVLAWAIEEGNFLGIASKREFADRIGVSYAQFNRYAEGAVPPADKLIAIADALGMSMEKMGALIDSSRGHRAAPAHTQLAALGDVLRAEGLTDDSIQAVVTLVQQMKGAVVEQVSGSGRRTPRSRDVSP